MLVSYKISTRKCIFCKNEFVLVKGSKKIFCTNECRIKSYGANFKDRPCKECDKPFIPYNRHQMYCHNPCFNKKENPSNYRYNYINGDWRKYIQSILSHKTRTVDLSKDSLKMDDLLCMLEKQNYKCAVSGVQLTCIRKLGTQYMTNLSIDRIDNAKEYSMNNIRFVCRYVNTIKWTFTDEEMYGWCESILRNRKNTNGI